MKNTKIVLGVILFSVLLLGTQSVKAKEPEPLPELVFLADLPSYNPQRFELSRRLEEIWTKELGMKIKRKILDYNAMMDLVLGPKHDYGMMIMHWTGTNIRFDPDVFTYQMHHSSMDKAFAYNAFGYKNPEFDKIAERQRTTYDREKRRQMVWKCQEILYEDLPQTPFLFDQLLFVYNSDKWADPNNYHKDIDSGPAGFWFQWGAAPKTKDDIMRLAYSRPVKRLNPLLVTINYELWIVRNIYDSLARVGPDGTLKMWAAENIALVNDTTFDVLLRNDLKFHDGKRCTVEDVKFTIEFMKKWQAVNYLSVLKVIKNVEIIGDRKLRINLEHPFAPIYYTIFGQLPILPKHIWEEIEKDGKDPKTYPNLNPIGSGPFKFAYLKEGSELMLKRFDDHFQPAKTGGLLYLVYGSNDAMVGAVETAEADVTLYYIQPFQFKRLKAKKHISGEPMNSHGFDSLWFNCRIKPYSDKAFRKALAHTIPAKQFIKDIWEGYASHETAIIGSANTFWHNPNLPPIEFNIEKAKRILKDAGYTWNNKGELCYP